MRKETWVFEPDYKKHKMDKEELESYLHLKSKGKAIHKNNKKYKRKPKHVKRDKSLYE